MSVFFQVVSLHFLKSSVHLSIEGKKNLTLEFCGKKAKNTKGRLYIKKMKMRKELQRQDEDPF